MKTKVMIDGFEGHVRRSLDRATKMERGEYLESEKIITFADPVDMLDCLGTAPSSQEFEQIATDRKARKPHDAS
jgi:hypothetical protein